MRRILTACVLGAALASGGATPREAYVAGVEKIQGRHVERLSSLAADYVDELERLQERLSHARGVNDAAPVLAEKARFLQALTEEPDPFEAVPELSEDAIVSRPVPLATLQKSYREKRIACGETRAAELKSWVDTCGASAQRRAADGAFAKLAKSLAALKARKNYPACVLKDAALPVQVLPGAPSGEKRARGGKSAFAGDAKRGSLPAEVKKFLEEPQVFDEKWKPEIASWKYVGVANYCHDGALDGASVPDELALTPAAKNFKGYVVGEKRNGRVARGGAMLGTVGKAMVWELRDSRDLVCMATFRTAHPALNEQSGPVACVAVKEREGGKVIGSIAVPMTRDEVKIYAAKHYTHNKLQLIWVEGRRRRSFTIPDHTPLRVIVGIAGCEKGESIEGTFVVEPSRQAMEF